MQRSPISTRDRASQHAQALKPTPPHTLQSPPARTPNHADREAGDRPKPHHRLVVAARLILKLT
jgi:hypothetical protein